MSYMTASLLHKIFTELTVGMAFLALACVCLGSLLRPLFRTRQPAGLSELLAATALVSAAGSGSMLILSMGSGFLSWPWNRLWATEMIYGKVGFALLGLGFWALLIIDRVKSRMSAEEFAPVSLFLACGGFASLVLASSAGGHLAHGRSILDPLFSNVGINPYVPIVIAPWWSMGIITSGTFFIIWQLTKGKEKNMTTKAVYAFLIILFAGTAGITKLFWSDDKLTAAQSGHMEHQMHQPSKSQAPATGEMEHKHEGAHEHMKHPETMPPKTALHPAEGASVKILSPKSAQVFNGDEIPIQFQMVKGKKGNHVHAYVDGELMGMFSSEKGTLTGIQPGHHILELRVVAEDHQTELEATDRVQFVVK